MTYRDVKVSVPAPSGAPSEDLNAWAARIVKSVTTPPTSTSDADWGAQIKELSAFARASSQSEPRILQELFNALQDQLAEAVRDQHKALAKQLSSEAAASLEHFVNFTVHTRLLQHALSSSAVGDPWRSLAATPQVPAAPEADPGELLSASELAEALGNLSDETVRLRERKGELFSILKPGRQRGREYPAFQAWPEVAGAPLAAVMEALGPARSSLARGFFASPADVLGGLTPLEVLVGRPLPARALATAAQQLLSSQVSDRLAVVKEAARAHAASAHA